MGNFITQTKTEQNCSYSHLKNFFFSDNILFSISTIKLSFVIGIA